MFDSGENWVVHGDSSPLDKHKFYLNVCRPVSYVSSGTLACDAFAAACETKISNGKVKTAKEVKLNLFLLLYKSCF